MRVPQVSDRIKEVPAQALRGVFAGIGQVLLITDRLRNKTPANQQVPQARRPERSETAAAASAAASADTAAEASADTAAQAPKAAPTSKAERAAPAEARDFDKTGNVRLLGGTGAGASDVAKITHVEASAEAAEAAVTDEAAGSAEATAPEAGAAAPEADVEAAEADVEAAEAGVAADAPLPNYDELSIASLRARLRNLDVAQVRQLAEYERAHAARAEVIAMFERRIAKLEAETSADARAEAEVEAEVEARTEVAADTEAEVEAEAEAEA
jgi:hypothetical protein